MSTETTIIPVNPSTLKRGDLIRVRVTPNESQDVRVTGVKVIPRHTIRQWQVPEQVRVNCMDPEGPGSLAHQTSGIRRSRFFTPTDGGPEERFACRIIPLSQVPTEAKRELGDAAPCGYLMDEVGDIAYREGDVGAWLRVDGQWAEHPRLFWWDDESHRLWRVL